jgi:hypothetical protein
MEWLTGRPSGGVELQTEVTHNEVLRTNVQGARTQIVGTAAEPRWVARGDIRYTNGPLRLTYEAFFLPHAYAVQGANTANNAHPLIKSNVRQSISAIYSFGRRYELRAGVIDIFDRMTSYPSLFYGDILGRRFFVGLKARY